VHWSANKVTDLKMHGENMKLSIIYLNTTCSRLIGSLQRLH